MPIFIGLLFAELCKVANSDVSHANSGKAFEALPEFVAFDLTQHQFQVVKHCQQLKDFTPV